MSIKDYLKERGIVDRLQEPLSVTLRPELLLQPNTPKPMHGVAPRVVLGSSWWDKERKQTYLSTDYHCLACGVHRSNAKRHKWMEGHEVYDIDYRAGRLVYVECVPLCHYCHNYIHDGRLSNLLRQGSISHQKFKEIIQHGDKVLKEANLSRDLYTDRDEKIKSAILVGQVAEWQDWRMVVNGIEYPPLYKDFEEWKKVFG